MATKGPTKDEESAAKTIATPHRDIFYKTSLFNNAHVEKAAGDSGRGGWGIEAGKVPKDIKDPRLQIELHVFSHNGGVQTFSPHRDGVLRSGAWNACVVSSNLLKALPFFDGGRHLTNAEEALTADDVPTGIHMPNTFVGLFYKVVLHMQGSLVLSMYLQVNITRHSLSDSLKHSV